VVKKPSQLVDHKFGREATLDRCLHRAGIMDSFLATWLAELKKWRKTEKDPKKLEGRGSS
jgi:hypothetical protein